MENPPNPPDSNTQRDNKNTQSDDRHYAEEDNQDGTAAKEERGKDKCPQNGYCEQRPKNKGKKCYCKGDPNYNKKRRDGDEHVVENFEGTRSEEFDEEICPDRYCMIHRRKHCGVSPIHDRPPMYWRHPQGPQPPWIGELPRLPLPPYGYPSSSMPPLGYGGRSRRPPFGHGYYGDYDEPNRGCSPM